MKVKAIIIIAIGLFITYKSHSQIATINKNIDPSLFREVPILQKQNNLSSNYNQKDEKFKPSIQVGAIVHMFGSYQQTGYGPGGNRESTNGNNPDLWTKEFNVYRARILVGGKLSKNGSFFMETDIPSAIGMGSNNSKNVKVSPIILDAQYEHTFGNHTVIAGMQLVSHNRNGLQGAAGLMANDFTYYQYPHNLFAAGALQGNFGRDLGVNVRGFFLEDKLEYRIGAFTGRNTGVTSTDPALRYVGRLVYNFLDSDKDYYYAGTKLGNGKTISLGAGFDMQGTYSAFGPDLFIDIPLGTGSITLNTAYSLINGGTDKNAGTSFVGLIPKSTTQYLELGYYFKKVKLQPWIRYEKRTVDAENTDQTGGVVVADYNKLNTATVFGGGINYWFAEYNTNLRLSYMTWGQENTENNTDSYGQLWLQVQFFIF